jgi:hypothetical protein
MREELEVVAIVVLLVDVELLLKQLQQTSHAILLHVRIPRPCARSYCLQQLLLLFLAHIQAKTAAAFR